MTNPIERVAVIGAGTMGAGIAAHIANAGFPVTLLDIVPPDLSPDEANNPKARNRFAINGFERAKKGRPPAFMSAEAESLVTLGNIEDDFEAVAQADWIIEVIIEKLEPKQELMARIEAVRKPSSIVTSNSSGLPMASISEGRSDDFKEHFFGTHFFNPPRYLKLLEIIPTEASDLALVAQIRRFGEDHLGKGIVLCKDTPNFIGNRLFSVSNSYAVTHAIRHGYSVQEVDDLTGPLLGRPKTGTFRLKDLVGIDIAEGVAHNLYDLIPHDPYREILHAAELDRVYDELLQRKWLGNKTGQGFYKQGKDAQGRRVFLTLNFETFEYEMPTPIDSEAVREASKIRALGERVSSLLADKWAENRGAQYIRALLSFELSYAAHVAPEIAHNLRSIDEAIRWGFAYQAGPFEMWDLLGVSRMVEIIKTEGHPVADWVTTMLDAGIDSFYRREDGRITGYYDWDERQYLDMPPRPKQITLAEVQAIETNDSGTIHHMGEGVLLLEYHTKANALNADLIEMMQRAYEMLQAEQYVGLVIGNEGSLFSAGGDLRYFLDIAESGNTSAVLTMLKASQDVWRAFRQSVKPVVVALHGRALGGGLESTFGSSRVVAHAESSVGLPEIGVGVVPAGGGVTTLVRRVLSKGMQVQNADPLPLAMQIFETIGYAKISQSAAEARQWGYLTEQDRIIMNRDQLLYEGMQEVLKLVDQGYAPPPPTPLYAGGRDLKAAIKMQVWMLHQAQYASDHDKVVADKLAHIIAGGDLSGEQWVDEQYFLDLEREAFGELIEMEATRQRIEHMLNRGKPLRN